MRFQQENSLKMASDYEGASSSPSFVRFGRSILSMKRGTTQSTLPIRNHNQEQELEAFQIHVTQSFIHLSSSSSSFHQFLSLVWLSNLLDTFLSCQHKFYTILFNHKLSYITTTDKLILDYLERCVKGLDICNSIRDGIQQMGLWQKQLEIVSSCVLVSDQKNLAQAQLRRAKKAITELQVLMMLDDKESSSSAAAFAHRNRSFQKDNSHHQKPLMKQFRSMSWSVSRSWSASKQLEAIGNNIVLPKTNNNGLAVAVYTMSNVLLFVMWALVATIPCQDGGLRSQFNTSALKSFTWGPPIVELYDRIMEESKKRRGRRTNANCGLLKEIQVIEGSVNLVNKLFEILIGEGKKEEQVRKRVEEVVTVCDALKNGLDPLEKKVRQVFHAIVHTRFQGLDSIAFSRGCM